MTPEAGEDSGVLGLLGGVSESERASGQESAGAFRDGGAIDKGVTNVRGRGGPIIRDFTASVRQSRVFLLGDLSPRSPRLRLHLSEGRRPFFRRKKGTTFRAFNHTIFGCLLGGP